MKSLKYIKQLSLLVCAGLLIVSFSSCKEEFEYRTGVFMSGTQVDPLVNFIMDGVGSTYNITATSTSVLKSDVRVKVEVRNDLVEEYNNVWSVSYWEVPESVYSVGETELVIPAGGYVSDVCPIVIEDESDLETGRVYIIPVTITEIRGGDVDLIESMKTIYLKLSRTLRFYAPYVGSTDGRMSYQFIFDNPITSIPVFTYEVKIYMDTKKPANTTTRVCSFGGNATSQDGVVDDGDYNCDQVLLRFGENPNPQDVLQVMTPSGYSVSSNTVWTVGQWHHVAITFDGENLVLYVDGVRDNFITRTPNDFTMYGVQIGMPSRGYVSAQLFLGRLSEMRLWTRVLSAREIRAGVCGTDPLTDGLVAYWRMNEGSGVDFFDSSPGGRHIRYNTNPNINWTYDDTNLCVE